VTAASGTRRGAQLAVALCAAVAAQSSIGDTHDHDASILVRTSAELLAALNDRNAGRRIHLLRGTYRIDRPILVPDGATLSGDGVMRFDDDGTPLGFEPATESIIEVASGFTGDVLTFGNGAAISRLVVRDIGDDPHGVRRVGNAVVVASRARDDVVVASIAECEISTPNPPGFADAGPTGHGVLAMTRHPIGHPFPDEGAAVTVRLERSIVRVADKSGAVFAINFASRARTNIVLIHNLLEGALIAVGATNRLHEVVHAETTIESDHNRFVWHGVGNDSRGWLLYGGSSPPHFANTPAVGLAFDTLRVKSVGDRIEGFFVGILAAAARRVLPATGPASDNVLDLDLEDLRIRTPGSGAADWLLSATLAEQSADPNRDFDVGDRNTLRARIKGVNGSGPRANVYALHVGPTLPGIRDEGSRIEFGGDAAEFARSNTAIEPAPPPEYFIEPGSGTADRP